MKSDETTKSAGYVVVFGFNLRQLTRYLMGEMRTKNDEQVRGSANNAQMDKKPTILAHVG
jgi:hypothetical protein